ncbi:MAG: hypothetical protein GY720_17845 [bacterium]|nr:hypothetical protein [bacterium]
MTVQSGFEMFAAAGLVMQASLPVDTLPDWATHPMVPSGVDLSRYQSLVMLGQGGTRLWEYIAATSPRPDDTRFDNTAYGLAEKFVEDHIGGAAWEVVYPGHALLPLGRLAELAGWGRPSSLGLTINDRYGLWMAHRIVFLVDAPAALVSTDTSGHPCDTCLDTPCVTACPVGAVDATAGFDVDTCAAFRIEVDSVCAYQCLARLACPVAVEHRYGSDQMAYHYGSGLASIRRYYGA